MQHYPHCFVININTDGDYSRAMDPDMAPGSSTGLVNVMALGGSADYQICMVLTKAQTWKTNMALGGSSGP